MRHTSIEPIPTWALPYIINGDPTGLEDEDIKMVDDAIRDYKIEIVQPIYGQYFSIHPLFGLPAMVEDCEIISK